MTDAAAFSFLIKCSKCKTEYKVVFNRTLVSECVVNDLPSSEGKIFTKAQRRSVCCGSESDDELEEPEAHVILKKSQQISPKKNQKPKARRKSDGQLNKPQEPQEREKRKRNTLNYNDSESDLDLDAPPVFQVVTRRPTKTSKSTPGPKFTKEKSAEKKIYEKASKMRSALLDKWTREDDEDDEP